MILFSHNAISLKANKRLYDSLNIPEFNIENKCSYENTQFFLKQVGNPKSFNI